MTGKEAFQSILDSFMASVNPDVAKYARFEIPLKLPSLSKDQFLQLLAVIHNIFENEPILLDLTSPCVVIGDIHGHLLDIYRILFDYGPPSERKYVFLGDIVDRGEFSVESLQIIYLMKALWPENVYIIRGNHEFEFMCTQCGFETQMRECYGERTMFEACLATFAQMPLAARIDGKVLCVHGGIGPAIETLDSIRELKRPITEFGDPVIDSLTWSDPSEDVKVYQPSARGTGYLYGEKPVELFQETNGLNLLVRGHECVEQGYEFHFNQKLITVFSASNYCGLIGNQAAVLEINGINNYCTKVYSPLEYLLRKFAFFSFEKSGMLSSGSDAYLAKIAISKTADLTQVNLDHKFNTHSFKTPMNILSQSVKTERPQNIMVPIRFNAKSIQSPLPLLGNNSQHQFQELQPIISNVQMRKRRKTIM